MVDSLAALIGNGASIAYNPDLRIETLTSDLLDSFRAAGGDLQSVASDPAVGNADEGFEALLGPFDQASELLQALPGLHPAGPLSAGFEGIRSAAETLRGVYRQGMALTLDLIAQRAHGRPDGMVAIEILCREIARLSEPSEIAIATLSYDGLLPSGFLTKWVDFSGSERTLETSDLGDGRSSEIRSMDFTDGRTVESHGLRVVPDFLPGRARLINLHGSLGWLRDSARNEYRKFSIDTLRENEYWSKLRRGETDWEPVVVLTNIKTRVPERYPFSIAYETFFQELLTASHWLLVGYGFGDIPVNETIRRAAMRRAKNQKAPAVLLVGTRSADELRRVATSRAGIPSDWLTASSSGVPEACSSLEWEAWSTSFGS